MKQAAMPSCLEGGDYGINSMNIALTAPWRFDSFSHSKEMWIRIKMWIWIEIPLIYRVGIIGHSNFDSHSHSNYNVRWWNRQPCPLVSRVEITV